MSLITDPEMGVNIGIYVLPSCSLFGLAAIEAPLLHANNILGYERYRWVYIADSAARFAIAPRVELAIDYSIDDTPSLDVLLVIGERPPEQKVPQRSRQFLQRMARQAGMQLGGLDMGGFWLAEAGVLDGQPLALHWQGQAQFAERYPRQALARQVGVLDGERLSGAGQSSNLDFMLHLIETYGDEALSVQVSQQLCMARIRPPEEPHQPPRPGGEEPLPARLSQALQLMETHLEEPLTTEDIAQRVNLSRRHLERLFRRHLDSMPARHYLELRLKHARQLLLTTNQSIIQIGLGCGFSSGPHFSSAYKAFFNLTPRDERNQRARAK